MGSGEEFAETQLRVCCRDLTGEVLNTGRENFSEGKLIYFIQTEGKGKGEDDLCLKPLATPRGRQRLSTKKGREKIIIGEA